MDKATGIIASTDSTATSQNISGQPSCSTARDASPGASAVPVHSPGASALMPWNRAGPGGIRFTVSRDEVSMAAHPVAISTLPSRKPASLSDKAHTTAPTPAAPSDASR
ncbi:hypothetical protein G6F24_017296 [Rhizopus arrhizus]|nr:hypothetical protein G6F24_017296 [Rhizopus arrhizus]